MFGFIKKGVSDLYIARPDAAAQSLVWRYGEQAIPGGAKVTVRADEVALFFKEGQLVGELTAGTHHLETANIPFLGALIVSPLTGDNHYLTELFFVRKTEHLHARSGVPLGTFQDIGSRLTVSLLWSAQIGVRVTNPAALILRIAGMQVGAADQVGAFLDARLGTLLAQSVGTLVAGAPVLNVVSNQYSEQLGREMVELARGEFEADGLALTRLLSLQLGLDADSDRRLRALGDRLADLGVKREQADVAAQPGYAAYQMLEGQKAMLEGIGAGAAAHGLPAFMPGMGVGLGGAMGGSYVGGTPSVAARAASGAPPSARLSGPPSVGPSQRWYLRGPSGVEGPYVLRQLVLRVSSLRLDAASAWIRRPGEEEWLLIGDVPDAAAEFARRSTAAPAPAASSPGAPSPVDAFERALSVAAADRVITRDEMPLLSMLAVAAGLAASELAAVSYIGVRARALGCAVEEAAPSPPAASPDAGPPPMPPPDTSGVTFNYSDGQTQSAGLSPDAVAERVRANPFGTHLVWTPGMAAWSKAVDVEVVRRLLG